MSMLTATHHAPPRSRIYDRRTVLGQLADGDRPEVVYGPRRPEAAEELAGYLSSIRLDEDQLVLHALATTSALDRRYAAYRAGVRFLHDAYYSYGLVTGPDGDLTSHPAGGPRNESSH